MNQKPHLFVKATAYLIESYEIVHDELICRSKRIFMSLNIKSIQRLMLLKPSAIVSN